MLSKMLKTAKPSAIIRLPTPHQHQKIFYDWQDLYPKAQCLVAPCGTKLGKTFGCSIWMLKEALTYPSLYCAWIAPTYLKCRIAYRYMKAMLPDHPHFKCVDGRLEIHLANGSFIKFLHGRDAEVTVEGEAVDRFVLDESGKITKQVWFSLFTTITQTLGYGICTGTPRGFTWYYEMFRKAKSGDPFYCWAQLSTEQSPFIKSQAIENAKRILPKHLYDQYYLAKFISSGSVFGDLNSMFDRSLKVPEGNVKFWIHPDASTRDRPVVHGMDVAKQKDYTVVYSTNDQGKLVGYCRYRHVPYPRQAQRFESYINRFFSSPNAENDLRYDATGVGVAFGDLLGDLDIDCGITPVTFTNKSKSEMVTRVTMAIEQTWHKAPSIERISHEFGSYELTVTKSGLHSYSAPDGEHDDVVSAALLSISGAYQAAIAEEAEKMVEQLTDGKENSDVNAWADTISNYDDDDFFVDSEGDPNDDDFDSYLEE